MRFVIADDMHTPRTVLQRILVEAGHTVFTAANGLEAVELAEQHRPDAVILDISMPGLSGDQAGRRVHAMLPDAHIFFSSNISNKHVQDALERDLGARFVTKPFRPNQLLQEIARAEAGV